MINMKYKPWYLSLFNKQIYLQLGGVFNAIIIQALRHNLFQNNQIMNLGVDF